MVVRMNRVAPAMSSDVKRAHQIYRQGKYSEALNCYTHALSTAKNKQQKIALHSNLAACYLKLGDFNKAAQECTSVLQLDQKHVGALMLRVQTMVTLKEYHEALFDANRLVELNPSSEVYRNLQARLKKKLSLAPIPEGEAEFEEDPDYIGETELEEYSDEQSNEEVEEFKDRIACQNQTSVEKSSAWHTIPKPRGHSYLDYSRWDRVEDLSSEEDDEEEEEQEGDDQDYKFRVKKVGLRAVKR